MFEKECFKKDLVELCRLVLDGLARCKFMSSLCRSIYVKSFLYSHCLFPSAPVWIIKQAMSLITHHSVVIFSQETHSWAKLLCQLPMLAHLNSSWWANAIVKRVLSLVVRVSKIIQLIFWVITNKKNKVIWCIWQ